MLRRFGRVRLTILSTAALTLACLALSGTVRTSLWDAIVLVAYALGITRPQLLLLPAVLILSWIAIDAAAVFVAFRVYDRREQRRARLRQRLLEEEGVLRPDSRNKSGSGTRKHH